MHSLRPFILALAILPSALLAATDGATTPAEAFRALQKAGETNDAAAMAAVLIDDERIALDAVVKAGVKDLGRHIPKGTLKITSEMADLVIAMVDDTKLVFIRQDSRWYASGIFLKAKAPIAVVQPSQSVRVEGAAVLTVSPIHGEGMPTESAIPAAKAYELLRAKARESDPTARLYTLDTGMYALSAEGAASGWIAEFITDTPGELLSVRYDDGDVEPVRVASVRPGRGGVPEPDAVGYDTKQLYEETLEHAAGVVDPITRVTASLVRSAYSGKAIWLLNVYNNDDRIGTTVVFDARTMKFRHKTK